MNWPHWYLLSLVAEVALVTLFANKLINGHEVSLFLTAVVVVLAIFATIRVVTLWKQLR